MPKPRPAKRKFTEFQTSPWQGKQDIVHPQASVEQDVLYEDLLAVVKDQPDLHPTTSKAASNPPVAATQTPWFSASKTGRVIEEPAEVIQEDEDVDIRDQDARRASPEPSMLRTSGFCWLAFLSNGRVVGQLVDAQDQTNTIVSGRECAIRQQACYEDVDSSVVMLYLTGRHLPDGLRAVVRKTGGDLSRLEPAEEVDIKRYYDLRQDQVDACMCVNVTYSADMLFSGPSALQHLPSFAQSLVGGDVVVNHGTMTVCRHQQPQ